MMRMNGRHHREWWRVRVNYSVIMVVIVIMVTCTAIAIMIMVGGHNDVCPPNTVWGVVTVISNVPVMGCI